MIEERMIRSKEVKSNVQEVCPIIFVIDKSGSMVGKPIEEVNDGITQFAKDIQSNLDTKNRLEIAIVAFDHEIDVLRNFSTTREQLEMPVITTAGGLTHTEDAIICAMEMIESRKQDYKTQNIPYKRPYLILLTDGETYGDNQDVERLASSIRKADSDKKFIFWAFGIADANMDELKKFTTENSIIQNISSVDNISKWFKWLSASFDKISTSGDKDKVDLTPDDSNDFTRTVHSGD